MLWQDIINGSYAIFGVPFIILNIIKLYKDKEVRGVSWIYTGYFVTLGFWNLYYWGFLDQWFSFYSGLAILVSNIVWMCQMIYYNRKES